MVLVLLGRVAVIKHILDFQYSLVYIFWSSVITGPILAISHIGRNKLVVPRTLYTTTGLSFVSVFIALRIHFF